MEFPLSSLKYQSHVDTSFHSRVQAGNKLGIRGLVGREPLLLGEESLGDLIQIFGTPSFLPVLLFLFCCCPVCDTAYGVTTSLTYSCFQPLSSFYPLLPTLQGGVLVIFSTELLSDWLLHWFMSATTWLPLLPWNLLILSGWFQFLSLQQLLQTCSTVLARHPTQPCPLPSSHSVFTFHTSPFFSPVIFTSLHLLPWFQKQVARYILSLSFPASLLHPK